MNDSLIGFYNYKSIAGDLESQFGMSVQDSEILALLPAAFNDCKYIGHEQFGLFTSTDFHIELPCDAKYVKAVGLLKDQVVSRINEIIVNFNYFPNWNGSFYPDTEPKTISNVTDVNEVSQSCQIGRSDYYKFVNYDIVPDSSPTLIKVDLNNTRLCVEYTSWVYDSEGFPKIPEKIFNFVVAYIAKIQVQKDFYKGVQGAGDRLMYSQKVVARERSIATRQIFNRNEVNSFLNVFLTWDRGSIRFRQ